MINDLDQEKIDDWVFIEIIPNETIYSHGVGYGILEQRAHHVETHYKVVVPK